MVELITNIDTSIEITIKGENSVVYTGDITGWNMGGFETVYKSMPTFGTTAVFYEPTKPGQVSFDFKMKNFASGTNESLLEMNKKANVSGWAELSDDKQMARKIILKWTRGSEAFIMGFYNVYGMKVTSAGKSTDLPTAKVEFSVAPFDEAGVSNYYDSTDLTHETSWDTLKGF